MNLDGLKSLSQDLESQNSEIRTVTVQIDTSSESDVQRMIDEGVAAFGAIHYCVNCAGVTSPERVVSHELSVESWDKVINVNLRGVWLCQRAQITQMLKQEADQPTR